MTIADAASYGGVNSSSPPRITPEIDEPVNLIVVPCPVDDTGGAGGGVARALVDPTASGSTAPSSGSSTRAAASPRASLSATSTGSGTPRRSPASASAGGEGSSAGLGVIVTVRVLTFGLVTTDSSATALAASIPASAIAAQLALLFNSSALNASSAAQLTPGARALAPFLAAVAADAGTPAAALAVTAATTAPVVKPYVRSSRSSTPSSTAGGGSPSGLASLLALLSLHTAAAASVGAGLLALLCCCCLGGLLLAWRVRRHRSGALSRVKPSSSSSSSAWMKGGGPPPAGRGVQAGALLDFEHENPVQRRSRFAPASPRSRHAWGGGASGGGSAGLSSRAAAAVRVALGGAEHAAYGSGSPRRPPSPNEALRGANPIWFPPPADAAAYDASALRSPRVAGRSAGGGGAGRSLSPKRARHSRGGSAVSPTPPTPQRTRFVPHPIERVSSAASLRLQARGSPEEEGRGQAKGSPRAPPRSPAVPLLPLRSPLKQLPTTPRSAGASSDRWVFSARVARGGEGPVVVTTPLPAAAAATVASSLMSYRSQRDAAQSPHLERRGPSASSSTGLGGLRFAQTASSSGSSDDGGPPLPLPLGGASASGSSEPRSESPPPRVGGGPAPAAATHGERSLTPVRSRGGAGAADDRPTATSPRRRDAYASAV